MILTNAFKEALLKLYFQNIDHANIGDAAGLQNSAAAGAIWLALHTAFPGRAGSQTTNEATYTGYARKSIARAAADWAVSAGATSLADNIAALLFDPCTAGANDIFYYSLGSASSGAGNLYSIGCLGTPLGPYLAESTNDRLTIKNHGLIVDDRVAFFETPRGALLPAGITEGTVYFVKTNVDADTIELSATSGGAIIDVTADGDGFAVKMAKLPVVAGVTPNFPIGNIDFAID